MSLYAQYISEYTGDSILETERGYATYRFLDEAKVYIIDIFVVKEFRRLGEAAKMADQICVIAKERGCREVLGTVSVKANNTKESCHILWAYGMKMVSANNDVIVFKKDL